MARRAKTVDTVIEARMTNGDQWKWENGHVHMRSQVNRFAKLPDAWIPQGKMDLCVFLNMIGNANKKGYLRNIMMW